MSTSIDWEKRARRAEQVLKIIGANIVLNDLVIEDEELIQSRLNEEPSMFEEWRKAQQNAKRDELEAEAAAEDKSNA